MVIWGDGYRKRGKSDHWIHQNLLRCGGSMCTDPEQMDLAKVLDFLRDSDLDFCDISPIKNEDFNGFTIKNGGIMAYHRDSSFLWTSCPLEVWVLSVIPHLAGCKMCKAFEGAENDGSDGSLRLLQVAMVNLHGSMVYFSQGMVVVP